MRLAIDRPRDPVAAISYENLPLKARPILPFVNRVGGCGDRLSLNFGSALPRGRWPATPGQPRAIRHAAAALSIGIVPLARSQAGVHAVPLVQIQPSPEQRAGSGYAPVW